jgi:hypothetical protein
MATTTIQIQDFANAVLEAYAEEMETNSVGLRIEKGKTGSEAIILSIFPLLSTTKQRELIQKYPPLARFANKKK